MVFVWKQPDIDHTWKAFRPYDSSYEPIDIKRPISEKPEKALGFFAIPSIPVLDGRIYHIPDRDKACHSCDDAHDTAMARCFNVKKLISLLLLTRLNKLPYGIRTLDYRKYTCRLLRYFSILNYQVLRSCDQPVPQPTETIRCSADKENRSHHFALRTRAFREVFHFRNIWHTPDKRVHYHRQ